MRTKDEFTPYIRPISFDAIFQTVAIELEERGIKVEKDNPLFTDEFCQKVADGWREGEENGRGDMNYESIWADEDTITDEVGDEWEEHFRPDESIKAIK